MVVWGGMSSRGKKVRPRLQNILTNYVPVNPDVYYPTPNHISPVISLCILMFNFPVAIGILIAHAHYIHISSVIDGKSKMS